MVMLSNVPSNPPEDTLARLQEAFFNSFKQHIFIKTVDIANWSSAQLPPYLQLVLACLGSVTAPSTGSTGYTTALGTPQDEVSAGLFVAGVNLWSVMLEVDNRETRLFEAILAVRVYLLYSIQSNPQEANCRMLCRLHYCPPMARCRQTARIAESRLAFYAT